MGAPPDLMLLRASSHQLPDPLVLQLYQMFQPHHLHLQNLQKAHKSEKYLKKSVYLPARPWATPSSRNEWTIPGLMALGQDQRPLWEPLGKKDTKILGEEPVVSELEELTGMTGVSPPAPCWESPWPPCLLPCIRQKGQMSGQEKEGRAGQGRVGLQRD